MKKTKTKEEIKELIKRRRFQLALHATIYYVYDTNIIPDHVYDGFSEDLVKLQAEYPDLSKEVELYEAFKDFDGSTGFHLTSQLDFHQKALHMIRLHEEQRRV